MRHETATDSPLSLIHIFSTLSSSFSLSLFSSLSLSLSSFPCDCSGRRRVIFYPSIHCYNCSLTLFPLVLSFLSLSLSQADFHPRGNVLVAEEMISLNEFTFHPPVSLSLLLQQTSPSLPLPHSLSWMDRNQIEVRKGELSV